MTFRRAVVAASLSLAVIVCVASPASAHTLTGVAPTNYRSEITSVSPQVSGVTVTLLDLGRRISITNDTDQEITVVGYQGENYLRIGRDGVFENTNSPTTYANRTPSQTPPATATATAAPAWSKVSDSHTAVWRDQRTRWEGPPPAEVITSPNAEHLLKSWQIVLNQPNTSILVNGRILWVPPPSSLPWAVLIVVAAVVVALIGWLRNWVTPLRIALGSLVAIDIVNATGSISSANSGIGRVVGQLLTLNLLNTIGWIALIAATVLLRDRNDKLLVAIGAGAAWVTVVTSALNDLPALSQSELPTELAPALGRAYVSLTIGIGAGIVIASLAIALRERWLVLRRAPARR